MRIKQSIQDSHAIDIAQNLRLSSGHTQWVACRPFSQNREGDPVSSANVMRHCEESRMSARILRLLVVGALMSSALVASSAAAID
jgi:hypothetical protein